MTAYHPNVEPMYEAIWESFATLYETYDEVLDPIRAQGKKIGGYACITDLTGRPLLIMAIGECDPDKAEKQLEFCQEKCRRLAAHHEHELSYQSRNPEQNRWGGAAQGKDLIASFSGLPERLDEYLALTFLLKLGAIEEERIEELLMEHDNEFREMIYLMNFG